MEGWRWRSQGQEIRWVWGGFEPSWNICPVHSYIFLTRDAYLSLTVEMVGKTKQREEWYPRRGQSKEIQDEYWLNIRVPEPTHASGVQGAEVLGQALILPLPLASSVREPLCASVIYKPTERWQTQHELFESSLRMRCRLDSLTCFLPHLLTSSRLWSSGSPCPILEARDRRVTS